ncbi:MAG: hypothetical protein JNL42_00400 [Anaerolineae bacterium]|nr:hypothetical protein [Anaerolineae bacterium]
MIGGPLGGRGMLGAVLAAAGARRTYAGKVLSYSPLAYWKLDELSGSAAADSSGNGYNAAYGGVTLNGATGPDGKAAPSFDGTNDFINLYSAGYSAAFPWVRGTVMFWFKAASAGVWTDSTLRYLGLYRLNGSSNQIAIYKLTTANTIRTIYEATGSGTKFRDVGVSSTGWVHYAFTWDADTDAGVPYFNGVAAAPLLTPLSPLTGTGGMNSNLNLLGASSVSSPANGWSGAMAHAAVFSTALSAAAVADLAVAA